MSNHDDKPGPAPGGVRLAVSLLCPDCAATKGVDAATLTLLWREMNADTDANWKASPVTVAVRGGWRGPPC